MKREDTLRNIRLLIPAYNVAAYLAELLEEALKYIPAQDIIVVDDGSTDRTSQIARRFGVELLTHEKNQGKGAALLNGFNYLIKRGVEWVITIDGDMQHDPAMLPDFIAKAESGEYDIVIGARRLAGNMPWDRRFSNWSTSRILLLVTGRKIKDSQCGYRLIRCSLLRSLIPPFSPLNKGGRGDQWSRGYEFETECLLKLSRAGAEFGWIDIPTHYKGAPSSINRFKDTLRFLKVVIRFVLPLTPLRRWQ